MDRQRLYVVIAVVLVAIGSVVVLLFTGEAQPQQTFDDPGGDAIVEEGDNPPIDLTLADVKSAEVRDDGEIVFEAQLGGPIPKRLTDGALGLRWEVYEGGDSTFLITANLDVGPNAYIVAEQNSDFGGSTLDETFPGSIEVVDDTISIRVDAEEVPGFPTEFGWLLKTSLDGDQGDAESARAEDRAPDQGFGEYPADS